MKYIAVLLFTMMSLLSVGQVKTYVIEASDTLSTNNVLRINGDIFNSTTKVSVNDTTLVSLQYLASVLASTEGVDSLSFNPVTGYLLYYSGGAVVDSLSLDGRYLTTEVDGSTTNELQSLSLVTSGTDRTINIAGGTGVTFSVADNDNSTTNEIQDLSGSGSTLGGYTISLSDDATPVTLPIESDPVYSADSSSIVWFDDLDIIRSTIIEASDSLITRGVLQIDSDKFKATTQVSSDDTTLVSLDYLTNLLDNAEYADSLAFHSNTGYLVYYRQGVALDSTSLDGRYLTAEVDGSVTNELQNLSLGTVTTTTQPVNISSGTGVTLPAATTSAAGLMTSTDKSKLDNIEANANNYNHPTGFTDQPTSVLSGASVISQIDVTTEGHVQGVSTRALSAADIGAEATQTKGSLTESVTGLEFSATRQVIGGAADLSLTAGYEIPTITNISNWNTAYTNRITSLTTTGNSGTATLISNVLNIPNYTLAGLGFSYPSAGIPISTGTGWNTSIADNSANWNTAYGWGNHASVGYYNSSNFLAGTHYQAPLTNPVTGTGTTNHIPKFTGLSTLGNSLIYDNGTNIGIGTTSPQSKLHINANQSGFASYIHNNVNTPGYNGLQISAWDGSVNTKYLEIIQQGNPLLLVNGFGYVGIGTTDPTANLDVNGNARFRSIGTTTTSTVLGVTSDGTLTTNVSITDRLLSATANTSFTFDITAYESASVSTNTDITVTFSNIVSGRRGSIEVVYTGASVVTFTIPSGYALYIGSTLYNSGTGLSKTVLSKSTGNAIYNYYVSGTNIYIDGNQNYN